MRLAYFDESGVSNSDHEPIMVVAGVIVDGDKQWKAVEAHLDRLLAKHVPNLGHVDFSFHAYELFNGAKFFNKDRWALEKRLEILDALAAIPTSFDLPICHCSVDRKAVADLTGAPIGSQRFEQTCHAHAFFYCVLQVEIMLRATTDEVAILIAEDRELVRRMLKVVHSIFRGRDDERFRDLVANAISELPPLEKLMPFQRVIETVHFARKSESRLLQLADLCAFAIKRHITGKPHSDRLFSAIRGQFIFGDHPVGFGPLVHGVKSAAPGSP